MKSFAVLLLLMGQAVAQPVAVPISRVVEMNAAAIVGAGCHPATPSESYREMVRDRWPEFVTYVSTELGESTLSQSFAVAEALLKELGCDRFVREINARYYDKPPFVEVFDLRVVP